MKPIHLLNLILVLAVLLSAAPTGRTAGPTNVVGSTDAKGHFGILDRPSVRETVPSSRGTSMAQKAATQRYAISDFDRDKTYTADQTNKSGAASYSLQEDDNNGTCIFSDFSSVAGLTRNGYARRFIHKLRLTPATRDQLGSAWCNNKQLIQHGFETTFQFQITDLAGGGADGFAFVIQNDSPSALGDPGEGIGYASITNSLAIEFDTQYNPDRDDPDINHISIQACETEPNSAHHDCSLDFITEIDDISDEQIHTAMIEYVPGTMRIFLDSSPVLTTPMNLTTVLNLDGGTAWVGFTAATGDEWENHDILNWAFYPAFDLSADKLSSAGAMTIDTNLTYTVTVANNGPLETTGVVLTDTLLPLSATFDQDSIISNRGNCSTTSALTVPHFICNLGTLNAGDTATITAIITPGAIGMVTNTVNITADETDPNIGNNTAIAHTPVCVPPVANFTAGPELSGCKPLHVYFTDTSTGTVTNWFWTFGTLGHSTRQNPDHPYLSTGVYTVTLTASCHEFYPDTITRSHYITVVKPSPPEARNVHITPESLVDDDADLTFDYEYYDWCNKLEGDTRIGWTRDGQIQFAFDNQKVVSDSVTLPGERWCAAVTPHNGYEYGDTVEDCVYIEFIPNHQPQILNVAITPTFPTDFDDLELTYVYTDTDHDLEDENRTELRWYRNNTKQVSFTNNIVLSNTTYIGEIWLATVRPHDGEEYGEEVRSNYVIIRPADNYLPQAISVTITPTQPETLNDLNLNYICSDHNDDPKDVTAQLRWYRDDLLQPAFNMSTVPAINTLPGERWYATVRCYDGKDYGLPVPSAQVSIRDGHVNTPPEVRDVRITPIRPGDSDHLRLLYTYLDIDDDFENGSQIHWYKNGEAQSDPFINVTVIPSSATTISDTWYAHVVPYDGEHYGAPVAAHSVTVQGTRDNTPPKAQNVHLSPGQPGDNSRLELHYVYFDAEGDPEGATRIRWRRNGVTQTTVSSLTVVPSDMTIVSDQWCVSVKPYDGEEYGQLVEPDCITVSPEFRNTPPEAQGVHIKPEHLRLDDRLRLYYVYFDVDSDPEGASRIRWYRNGVRQGIYDDTTVVPAPVSRGEKWFATVQVTDSLDYGTTVTTPDVFVNSLPRAISVTITPTQSNVCQNLYLDYYYEDDDKNLEGESQIRWYNGGTLQPYDDRELPANATSVGQSWHASVAPHDGYEYGPMVEANAITITKCPTISVYLPIVLSHPRWDKFYEENDLQDRAYPLEFDRYYYAYPDDLDDWYYVFLQQTVSLHVLVTDYSAEGQLVVYDSNRQLLGNDGRELPTMEVPNEHIPNALRDLSYGRYYIRIYSTGNTNTNHLYQLIVTYEP